MSETNNTNNKTPDNFKVSGDWAAQSKALKSRFSLLTDSDLQLEPGKDIEMLDRIQQRLNKNREDAIRIIRSAEHDRPATPGQGKL
jgi:hypothetical protein